MTKFSMHSIKREARKEAWYGDSSNPFRKVGVTRSSTYDNARKQEDPEMARDELRHMQSEPVGRASGLNGDDVRRPSKASEVEMTKAGGPGRSSDPDSTTTGETMVEKQSTRAPSQEMKARQRFVGKFFGKNKQEDNTDNSSLDDTPEKRPWYKGKVLKHKPFTVRNQLQATIFNSWVNILLLAAPVGIAVNYAKLNGVAIFVVNFIAIIPLAGMLSFATEEIALHVGESLGGLLNASFGNAVEIIVAVIALAQDKIVIVQTSLIGSMLSNLLLVLGMCFFFGGLRRQEQFFNQTIAQTAASLLALAVGSIIIPTCFDKFALNTADNADQVAALSRGTAVILLVVYAGYLYFQLKTHSEDFNKESQKVPKRPKKNALPDGALAKGIAKAGGIGAAQGRAPVADRPPNDELIHATAYEEADEEPEEPQLHIAVAWATLAGATAIIGLCAEFMVDGISAITESGAISEEFVGLILLPIVGNAAEHATAVTVAVKDKMDLAIGVAVGSSMQIALLVIPLAVIIGWIMGKVDMTLSFDGFQVAVLFVAVLLVNYLIGDGKSHWLEGMLLMCLYLIIAVCAWYYPQAGAA